MPICLVSLCSMPIDTPVSVMFVGVMCIGCAALDGVITSCKPMKMYNSNIAIHPAAKRVDVDLISICTVAAISRPRGGAPPKGGPRLTLILRPKEVLDNFKREGSDERVGQSQVLCRKRFSERKGCIDCMVCVDGPSSAAQHSSGWQVLYHRATAGWPNIRMDSY